jgi:15-cis-phytoene synthase
MRDSLTRDGLTGDDLAGDDLARHDLAGAYRRCQALHRRHGRSYYLATRLLPAWKRRHVHALYGFTRYADEIVDAPDGSTTQERERRLRAWGEAFRAGDLSDPLLPAVLHTVEVFGLDRADFDRFLGAMAMDLTVRRYRDYAGLLDYMAGSAGAIGTMMLPILLADAGPAARPTAAKAGAGKAGAAREPARQLGLAFQLTNFIRDIAEDLSRDRVYLPEEDLDRFGVTVEDLRRCARRRAATAPVRELVAFEVARAREHYALAAPGVTMLPGASQSCIRAAYRLYGGILGEIVRAGYDVFGGRVRVSVPRRLALAAASLATRPGHPVSPFDL